MGGGKSTILQQLKKRGFMVIDEPARQILAEQRNIGGEGIPEKNPQLFTELMLSRAIFQFKEMHDYQGPIIFDRGIADNIAYASLFNLKLPSTEGAAGKYCYNEQVFFATAWEGIYCMDDERRMSFAEAKKFAEEVRSIYENLGYKILDLPLDSPEVRAKFILDNIARLGGQVRT